MVRQKGLCGRGFGNNNDNVWACGVSMVTQIEEEAQEGDGEGDCSDQLSNDQYHSPTKVPEYIGIKVRASPICCPFFGGNCTYLGERPHPALFWIVLSTTQFSYNPFVAR